MKRRLTTLAAIFLSSAILSVQAGHHSEGSYEKMPNKPHDRMAKRLKKIDTDGDGKMSRAEFVAHAEQRFAKMDADGDGFVTTEEGKAAHKKMREEHKQFFKKRHQEKTQSEPE